MQETMKFKGGGTDMTHIALGFLTPPSGKIVGEHIFWKTSWTAFNFMSVNLFPDPFLGQRFFGGLDTAYRGLS